MTPVKSKRLERVIVGGMMLANVLVVCLTMVFIGTSRRHFLDELERSVVNFVQLLEERVRDRTTMADNAAARIRKELLLQLRTGPIDGPRLLDAIGVELELLPVIDAIRVTDATGRLRWGRGVTEESALSYADQEFWAVHKNAAAGQADHGTEGSNDTMALVSGPLPGLVSKHWEIAFTRSYHHPDGRFAGVVVATVDTASFENLLAGLMLGKGSTVVMRFADMSLIARHPALEGEVGMPGNKKVSGLFAELVSSGRTEAIFHTENTPDGVERTYGFRRVNGWPFTLAVGMAENEFLAPWRREMLWILGSLLIFMACSVFFVRLMVGQLRLRLHAERQQSEDMAQRKVLEEQSRDGIVVLDGQGKVRESNRSFAEMLGYRLEEMSSLCVWDWDARWSKAELLEILQKVGSDGDFFETVQRRRDGKLINVELSSSGLETSDGKLISCICRDVTERHRAEDMLREREEQFRSLAEGNEDLICRFDLDFRLLYLNPAAQRVFASFGDSALGKTLVELGLASAECRPWERAVFQVFAVGVPVTLEFSLHGAQSLYILDCRLTPEFDRNGQVVTVLSVARDISRRREAEQNYLMIFREMINGFALHELIVDDQGEPCDYRFLAVNPAFERLTGLTAGQVIGNTALEVLPTLEKEWIERFGRVALTGEPSNFESYSAELGKLYQVSAFRPEPNRFACMFSDVTESRRVEEEHKTMQVQLSQSQKMEALGTLAGGIAHDFNNILGAIIGYAEMGRESCPSDSTIAADLDMVLEASQRAAALVKQILDFSRQTDQQKVILNPGAAAEDLVRLLRSTLPVTIRINLSVVGELKPIFADPAQFQQVLLNLCTNAFHAMEEDGGILDIHLRMVHLASGDALMTGKLKPGEYVHITVSDTGTGIPAEVKARIFDPYFTTKEVGKGTGLGLAIVHGIVSSSQGNISCRSKTGSGTVFDILLPACEPEVVEMVWEEEPQPGSERILLIEDEEILADLGKMMLERLGYEVTMHTSSYEALDQFSRDPAAFDLVITDQTMPGITGLSLAEKMLQLRPDLPIILCTGYSSSVDEKDVVARGIRGFAMKPLTRRDISGHIRRALDGNSGVGGNLTTP